jgi:hypothetical protein
MQIEAGQGARDGKRDTAGDTPLSRTDAARDASFYSSGDALYMSTCVGRGEGSTSLRIDFGAASLENDANTSQHRRKPNLFGECRLKHMDLYIA